MKSNISDASVLLTILVPCYNEANNIEKFYQILCSAIYKYNYKIIFINDGSSDSTLNILKLLSIQYERVFYISLSRNFGHQMALKAGYDHASDADCVVSLDADLQQSPFVILEMIEKWEAGYQVVNGIRTKNENLHFLKEQPPNFFIDSLTYWLSKKSQKTHPTSDFSIKR